MSTASQATAAAPPPSPPAPPVPHAPPAAPAAAWPGPGTRRAVDALATLAHALHGSRGLFLAATALLLLALLEPALPEVDRLVLTLPIFLLLLNGLFTLPREGVAAQWRARALLGDPHAVRKMLRRLAWPALLCILLLPTPFLALYGIPHISPLTGLVLPDLLRRISMVTLYAILLLPVLYLRSSRTYAPDIVPRRPRDLSREDGSHAARDVLLWMQLGILVAWALLTAAFWRPFSLLEWPPSLGSLRAGVRGLAGITFSLVVPVVLFTSVAAHLHLLRELVAGGRWRGHRPVLWLALLHVALALAAVCLHTYDILWIVRYQTYAPF